MWQRIIRVLFLILGGVILYISIARGSLDLMIKDEKENELRKVPIVSEFVDESGNSIKMNYKLPETRTLPSSPFYFLKEIRDYLWVSFTKNQLDKCRVLLLIADKKMEEVMLMNQQGLEKQIIVGTTIEAIDKLKLASEGLKSGRLNGIEKETIFNQIIQAKYAYKEIIKSLSINQEEQKTLTERLEGVI